MKGSKMKNVTEMTTEELLAEYNDLTGRKTTKFASRSKGEQQVLAARKAASPQDLPQGSPFMGMMSAKTVQDTLGSKVSVSVKGGKKTETVQKPAKPEVKKFNYAVDGCPCCKATEDQTNAGLEGTVAGDERLFCHQCSTEYWMATGKIYKAPKQGNRSEGIAESWKDEKTKVSRSRRDNVVVNGNAFRSVLEAFKHHHLPIARHIKFRIALKAEGKKVFKQGDKEFTFELANKQAELGL
jgi:hypothetical protein